jgi:hypothetical protein
MRNYDQKVDKLLEFIHLMKVLLELYVPTLDQSLFH